MSNNKNAVVDMVKWIEPKYKDYSLYVCTKRSIPHLIDGFKPSQRKIIFTAQRRAKNMIRVVSLSGYVIAESGYHHGDMSLNDAISLMAQGFTGSNNFPLLDNKGGFGNKFGASPSAPRYIYVKMSEFYNVLFSPEDTPILLESDNIEEPDPKFYVPIIPNVLLNGVSGIAVGFKVDIPPYNPKEIFENIDYMINNKEKRVELKPYYRGYTGVIQKEDDEWYMYGVIKKINSTTIEITEIPLGMTTEKYKKLLNNLIDENIIKDYDDFSGENWRFVIRAKRQFVSQDIDVLYSIFKLKSKIIENINVIYNGEIRQYGRNVYNLIEDFVKIRLDFYNKRKQALLDGYRVEILKYFIKFSVNKYVKSKHVNNFVKSEVKEYIINRKNVIDKYFDIEVNGSKLDNIIESLGDFIDGILTGLRLSEIYSDKMEIYQKNIETLTKTHNILYNKSVESIYKQDLKKIKKYLKELV